MPKSKRNKQISLTRTRKKSLEWKKNLVEELRSSVDNYSNIYIFFVDNMRNSKLKEVREQWKHSRFFFGKNKVMGIALGRTAQEEYRPNLHKISERLRGQCGLLLSNQPKDEVLNWFEEYGEADYARSGNTANCNIILKEGPWPDFHHSLEPYLRQLGMPTELQRGVVHLLKDFEVCRENEILTPEKARILKLIGHQMAEFRIVLDCHWSKDGTFTDLKVSSSAGKSHMEVGDMPSEEDEANGIENVIQKQQNGKKDQKITEVEKKDETAVEKNYENPVEDDERDVEEDDFGENENDGEEQPDDGEEKLEDTDSKDEKKTPVFKRPSDVSVAKSFGGSGEKIARMEVQSSPDEKSPVFRSLRTRTIKIKRKK